MDIYKINEKQGNDTLTFGFWLWNLPGESCKTKDAPVDQRIESWRDCGLSPGYFQGAHMHIPSPGL